MGIIAGKLIMRKVVVLALFLVACTLANDLNFLTQEYVDNINKKQKKWKAKLYPRFQNMTLKQLKGILGVKPQKKSSNIPRVSYKSILEYTDLPQNFDVREKWPTCKSAIRDQEDCGSCWAFGAVEAFEDRLCIQGSKTVLLSTQALVDCDDDNYGCGGGWPVNAWNFIADNGIPSESCYPYRAIDQFCQDKCVNSEDYVRYRAKNVRGYDSVEAVKLDILNNGPVETWFAVYDDFFNYESGIYSPDSDFLMGYHAVEVIGWGVEDNVPYWIAANSWNESWGDKGYFKIQAGTCEFDELDHFVAGDVVV
eukprot:TRINITY_DN340_c0_g1_i2.p1 TRINITY_DN340_c0_g1~~TRINITY_DN340_c0_g1_i2.p1  ORF type:complete len:318 (-),score=101.35 TRINITY_DN340_c0_g1_i2:177-1103(-)